MTVHMAAATDVFGGDKFGLSLPAGCLGGSTIESCMVFLLTCKHKNSPILMLLQCQPRSQRLLDIFVKRFCKFNIEHTDFR